jgi:hypothetical protein
VWYLSVRVTMLKKTANFPRVSQLGIELVSRLEGQNRVKSTKPSRTREVRFCEKIRRDVLNRL